MRQMVRIVLLLVMGLMCAAGAQAQTNPCTAQSTQVVADPAALYFTLTEFGRADFTQVVASVFQGAGSTAIDTVTIPKASLTLVAGTTTCYRTPWTAVGAQYVRDGTTEYSVASRADSSLPGKGSTQGPRGNPFTLSLPPLSAPVTRVGPS